MGDLRRPLAELVKAYFNLFKRLTNFRKLSFSAEALLSLAMIYYVIIFSAYSILTHLNYSTGTHDVGIYDQVIWNISRGHGALSSLGGAHLFSFHVSFYCFLLAPLFWLWSNINLLFIAQSAFLAAAVWPLFIYAKEKTGNRYLALAVGLSFLLYPALQGMNMENFHPEVITTFFLAWSTYFMLIGNYRMFYIFAFISLLGKEDVGLTVAFMGLYLLLFKKEARPGWTAVIGGLAYLFIANRVIMPFFNQHGLLSAGQPLIYSHWFGGFAQNIFNPAYYWSSIMNPGVFTYLRQLLEPAAYLPLLAPQVLFLALPQLLINALSRSGYFTSIHFHYNYAATVFIYFALVTGLARLNLKKSLQITAGIFLLVVALLENNLLSGLPVGAHWRVLLDRAGTAYSPEAEARRQALNKVPPGVGVSVSYPLYPQLGHRKTIHFFPNPFQAAFWPEEKPQLPIEGNADYLALILDRHPPVERMIIRYLLTSQFYQAISNESDILLLKKRAWQRPPGSGANYILYGLDRGISLADDFSQKLKISASGAVSNIYFPDSNYYFRNLAGETIPAPQQMALEIFGYVYIPAAGTYKFEAGAAALTAVEVGGQIAAPSVPLRAGWQKFKVKHLHNGGPFSLRLTVTPPSGQAYIIADHELLRSHDPAEMSRLAQDFEKKRLAKEAVSRRQPERVLNGGFEKVWGDIPQDWRLEVWQETGALCSYEITAREKRAGGRSASIIHFGLADSRWVQEVDVNPGANYRLSGWIKTAAVQRRGEGAFLEADGAPLRTEPIFGSNDWQYVEVSGKVPAGKKRVKVQCRLGYYGAINLGTAYFDGVSLKEIPPDYAF